MEYDNKCSTHKEYDIKWICSSCKVAVCDGCIVDNHRGHYFDFIKAENSKPIFEEFKNRHFQNLEKQIDINKELLNKSNITFKTLDENHTINLNTVTEEFKKLAGILRVVEVDKIKQLVTLYDENKEINTNISTIIDNNLNNINLITNKYKNTINQLNIEEIINNSKNGNNNNNNNNNHQHIEILKHCYQSQLLTKEDQNQNKIKDIMDQYKNVNIVNNSEQVRNSIKDVFEIDSSNIRYPKNVQIAAYSYFIYKNDNTMPPGIKRVAISPCVKTIQKGSIPASVQYLALLDGFKVQLSEGMIPQTVKRLFIGAIKKPLLRGSIPNGVSGLFLLDGFNQEISEIPPSVTDVYLFDTPITVLPYYNNVIYKSQRYKHNLTHPNVRPWDCTPYVPKTEF
ncbi:hypothetical protein ACTA71_003255 [Dictyostelium dimigraforme]